VTWPQAKLTAAVPPPPVTVRVAVPVLPLKAAVMVEVPAATAVARPLLTIVATDVVPELQVTCVVIFCVELSE